MKRAYFLSSKTFICAHRPPKLKWLCETKTSENIPRKLCKHTLTHTHTGFVCEQRPDFGVFAEKLGLGEISKIKHSRRDHWICFRTVITKSRCTSRGYLLFKSKTISVTRSHCTIYRTNGNSLAAKSVVRKCARLRSQSREKWFFPPSLVREMLTIDKVTH